MSHATYNITDDKIKLYIPDRLSPDDYKRAKSLNFMWYPGQKCFCAKWSVGAEDFALEFVPEIAEDDTPDDLEGRVERFEKYADNSEKASTYAAQRLTDATTDHKARMAEGTLKREADQAIYWTRRIAGAIAHAARKDDPGVISRRIRGLEADERKIARTIKESAALLALWQHTPITSDRARQIANYDHISQKFPRSEYPNSKYEGDKSLWSALDDGTITPEQAQALAIPAHEAKIARDQRYAAHIAQRLEYERAYLAAVAGEDVAEELTAPKPRRVTPAPADGLKKGDRVSARIWWANTGQTIEGPILSLGPRSVKVQLPADLDQKGYYAKGYQVARDRVTKL